MSFEENQFELPEIIEKEITLGKRDYRIHKLDPVSAFRWVPQLIGNSSNINPENLSKVLLNGILSFTKLEKKQLTEFFNDILKHAEVKYPAGWMPFIGLDGNYTTRSNKVVIPLLVHIFMFTVIDFFDPALMEGLVEGLTSNFPEDGQKIS